MAKRFWRAAHVETAALLPEKLVKGRAYFVDDEQVIVIDHGFGPVIYGGKPGPQGQPGAPTPQLQDQIDKLAAASITSSKTFWDYGRRNDKKISNMNGLLEDMNDKLQSQIDYLTHAVVSLSTAINTKFKHYDAAVATMARAISNLYPDFDWHFDDENTDDENKVNPKADILDDEVFTTESGTWRIEQTKLEDGTMMFELTAQDPLDGETITTDYGTWSIDQTFMDDGTLMFVLEAKSILINNVKAGDTIKAGASTYTVTEYRTEDGMIIMTLNG